MEKAIVFVILVIIGGSFVNSVEIEIVLQHKMTLGGGTSIPHFRFGEIRKDTPVLASTLKLTMKPGDEEGTPPHHHSGPVAGYVAQGEFLFQMKGGEPEILYPGQVFTEGDGDIHVWGANASNSTTTIVVVTIFGREGEEITVMDLDEPREEYGVALRKAKRRTYSN